MARYGFILAAICVVASGLLAAVNTLTKPKIAAQERAEEEAGLRAVLPDAASFTAVKEGEKLIYYKAEDKQGKFVGAAFRASGKGYSSIIETLAGMDRNGTILAIKILSQNETPGLGAKITENEFTSRFSNAKDLNNIAAITGATISSRAVIDSVREKAAEIKELIKNEK